MIAQKPEQEETGLIKKSLKKALNNLSLKTTVSRWLFPLWAHKILRNVDTNLRNKIFHMEQFS